ncbi:IclR family transcriptional regulator [Actinomadura algeriensis]|uniref:DNA-binding IclR family transcriptional regulator n=1 Tax=Actinomadura algeriensis TaxID=1679523 RepID=A0ABR9K411_9ACTN|nr:IclR family transcriptional regulator [Actinomadura algeriensis]MBE1537572.1 DNA-binding IclR family transcriptional regulator [Actinomadura algeriensis]
MPDSGFAADRDTPRGLLQTADRALLVLLGFDRRRTDWGVTEVAEEFGWDKSVAQRVLATLAHRGFLAADPDTRRYRIGPAALHLGRTWERSGSLRMLVTPILADLSRQTGDTALLSVPDGFHIRCVAAVDGEEGPLRYYPLVGELYPAHAGATAQAYFAFVPEDRRRRLFRDRPMARFTDRTLTDPDALERRFHRVRELGYAFTIGEYDAHVATLAVPVQLHGEPYGSLSLGGPEARFEGHADRLPRILRAAEQVERLLTGARRH